MWSLMCFWPSAHYLERLWYATSLDFLTLGQSSRVYLGWGDLKQLKRCQSFLSKIMCMRSILKHLIMTTNSMAEDTAFETASSDFM